jgi:ABC-2 type transport system permease protein
LTLLPVIFRRQLVSYFSAPATYLSMAAFLIVSATVVFQTGELLEHGSTDLHYFFQLHPWLYLLLIPVLCTHLWSDVHKEGAIDFLYSLPISYFELVIGKFLAAWVISALALLLTFPIIVTINYFGSPDNGVIASQFLGSWLLAGAYLSIGCLICVLTCHRLIIFMLTLALLLAVGGLSSVLDALDHQAPVWIVDTLLSLSPFARFSAIDNGTLVLQDYLFFISMTLAFLASTIVALKLKKAE